jgi:hypothetical protein
LRGASAFGYLGPMAGLKNELRWSHSRQRDWDTCRRVYFWAKYAHWGGWKRDADERTRTCYTLTKMMNLPMFAGHVVHAVIEKVLKDLRAGHTRSIEEWVNEGRRLLNEGWLASRQGKWRQDPKRNVNLFEHFHGLPVSEQDIVRTRDHVQRCIENFFALGAWAAIRGSDPGRWHSIESLESFNLGDFGVWVKIDFAMTDEFADLHLFDWKTGREDGDHRDQLLAYALYAHHVWGRRPGVIRLVPVYLRESRSEVIRVTREDLAAAEARILGACEAMANACDDPVKNTASIENFPMIENRRVCARCFFQSVCFKEKEWPCRRVDRES